MKEHFDNKYIDDIDEKIGDNYFSPVLDHVLDQILKIQIKDICDIGCGNGIFTSDIKQKVDCTLIGVDSNKYALEMASRLGFDRLIHINDFTKDQLPIDDASVDFVICKDVLEHLIDPVFLTNEISRILKPGGHFLVHVPNHFPIWGRLKFLLTNNIDTFSYFPESDRYNFPHIRFFTLSSMNNLLNTSGFESIENLSFFFAQPPLLHRLMPIWFRKLITKISTDNFSEGVTILARKIN
jgi:SAM-dependent methyltransferase